MRLNSLKRNGLLLGLLLATSAGAQSSGTSAGSLGGEWTVVGPDALLQGTTERPTLTLDGRAGLSGFAGCNRLSGRYAARGDVFLTSSLGLTKVACQDSEVMNLETALVERLNRLTRFALQGDLLTLKGGAGEVLLRRTSPRLGLPTAQGQAPGPAPEVSVPNDVSSTMPSADLSSAEQPRSAPWRVQSLVVGGRSYAVPEAAFTLTSGGEKASLSGSLGCNELTLMAQETGAAQGAGEWTFTGLRSTRMACPDDLAAAETALAGFLRGTVTVQQAADRVTFSSVNGELVLRRGQLGAADVQTSAQVWAAQYRAEQMQLGGRPVSLNPAVTVRFAAQPGGTLELSGSAGCNGLFGLGQPQAEGWTFEGLGTSLRFCPDMQAEAAVAELFQSPVTLSRDGEVVVLRSERGELRLTPQAASGQSGQSEADQSENEQPSGNYRLSALQRGGEPLDLGGFISPVRLSLTPSETPRAGQLGGSDGCNSFGGMYRLDGQTLKLEGTLAGTLMFCGSLETMPQLTETLSADPQLEQQGDTLTVTSGDLRWEFMRE